MLLLLTSGRCWQAAIGSRIELLRHIERELLIGLVHLGHETGVLLLLAEVLLDDVERLLVDLLVLVALQELDLVEAAALLDLVRVRVVDAALARVMQAELEDVLEAVERHLDDLGVADVEQVAQWRYHVEVDEVADLLGRAARGGVHNGPRRLLACLVLALGQDLDQLGEYVGVKDSLYLCFTKINIFTIDSGNYFKDR
jgi:hypothetical protein